MFIQRNSFFNIVINYVRDRRFFLNGEGLGNQILGTPDVLAHKGVSCNMRRYNVDANLVNKLLS